MTPPMTPREKVFVSASCDGERCRCGSTAVRKVGEEVMHDDPNPHRHNLTAYVCARHFAEMMGPAGARSVGYTSTALAYGSGDHAELARELRKFEGSDDLGDGDFTVCEFAADALEALLAENAALRSRENELIAGHAVAVTAMEHKRAEAVSVLRDIAKGEAPPEQHGHYLAHRKAVDAARTFLSKEAERG